MESGPFWPFVILTLCPLVGDFQFQVSGKYCNDLLDV